MICAEAKLLVHINLFSQDVFCVGQIILNVCENYMWIDVCILCSSENLNKWVGALCCGSLLKKSEKTLSRV